LIEENGIVVVNRANDIRHFKSLVNQKEVINNNAEKFISFLNPPTQLENDVLSRELLFSQIQSLQDDENIL